MYALEIEENKHILVVAPHPDDECIGAGGLLLKYHDRCSVLVLTDGAIGQGSACKEEEADRRKKEFIDEMDYLGISDYSFFDIQDGTLLNNENCLEEYNFSGTDYVFVTGNMDGHMDHTGAFLAVKRALSRMPKDARPKLFLYEVHKQIEFPTHWLDITESADKKKELIGFHRSQTEVLPYDEMAIMNAGYRALQNRMPGRFIEIYQEIKDFEDSDNDEVHELELKLQKHIQFYQLLVKWLAARLEGKSLAQVIEGRGIKSVAVYGYAELGKLLCSELSNGGIKIECVLDKNPSRALDDIKICFPEKGNTDVDAVIVTAIFYYREIKDELSKQGYKNIYSLVELVDWM